MKHEKKQSFLSVIFLCFFLCPMKVQSINLEQGKAIFVKNCMVCHKSGENVIIPEKNLKKNALEANGMYSFQAIVYQVINGKNGMPAFGGRLMEEEIENVASYVFKKSSTNFIEP